MTAKHHIEQEIKLTAPDEPTLYQLLESPLVQSVLERKDGPDQQRFTAIYYDTPDWALRELRWSLRTRFEAARHVGTLKRGGKISEGISSCEEIEQEIDAKFDSVGDIPPGEIARAMLAHFEAPTQLLPRVETNMLRTKRILRIGDTRLELVTDAGYIAANAQRLNLFEVELELLGGDLQHDEVNAFVNRLKDDFGLRFSDQSKHKLGLMLYD
ncbi:MAG: CYTH domain-containing protein [Methylococcales bacterium]|nr:CYTH domain-containing protein [Methylococcales bacterium]